MDGHRFDDLTRALAAGTSRRRVLKGLLGGAAGAALGSLGLGRGAAAAPRPVGATCIRADHCASGLCDQRTRRCVCPPGLAACNGACLDPVAFRTDPANCGACGAGCPGAANATATCAGGACATVCLPGFKRCAPTGPCLPETVCCVPADCPPPTAGTCQGTPTCAANACGFVPAASGTVCRAAGGVCGAAEVCDGVSLTCPTDLAAPDNTSCGTGQICCGGACVSNTTTANCGTCGTVCAASGANTTAVCASGQCALVCNAGFADCDGNVATGCETNTASDVLNCGACGNACPIPANATATCANGQCGFTCNTGFVLDTDGTCDVPPGSVGGGGGCDENTDCQTGVCCANVCQECCAPADCAAGAPPNTSPTCAAGTCGYPCATGFHACGGACVSNADPLTCGNRCEPCPTATPSCVGGVCTAACSTAADCPSPTGVCQTATCAAGVCGVGPAAAGSGCLAVPGNSCSRGLCTSSGFCRTAPSLGADPYSDGDSCDTGNPCSRNDFCSGGFCVEGELVCLTCETAQDCLFPLNPACQVRACNNGICGTASKPNGDACSSLTFDGNGLQICIPIGTCQGGACQGETFNCPPIPGVACCIGYGTSRGGCGKILGIACGGDAECCSLNCAAGFCGA